MPVANFPWEEEGGRDLVALFLLLLSSSAKNILQGQASIPFKDGVFAFMNFVILQGSVGSVTSL